MPCAAATAAIHATIHRHHTQRVPLPVPLAPVARRALPGLTVTIHTTGVCDTSEALNPSPFPLNPET